MAKSKIGRAKEKIEDAFVDQFLTREGESAQGAKERLRQSGRPQV